MVVLNSMNAKDLLPDLVTPVMKDYENVHAEMHKHGR